ncbi:MAG TPA: hypothetical protein VLK65_25015 [Vicinamibacteria bacterium]|nr:hypothetical protein [Vicinamibacteria bacterium]
MLAQPPDFSGTWRLDPDRSHVTPAAVMAGLIGAGAPETLHITQPANGTLVIESQINESHARIYDPDRETTTPVFVGQAGSITMTSRWEGRSLVSEGSREPSSGESASPARVREIFSLSADGRSLEIEITITDAEGESASSLRYTRIRDVGPCESWPSPCKDFDKPKEESPSNPRR